MTTRPHTSITQRLWLALAALTLVIIIGIIGFSVIEEMTPIDALYMTVITISTVGFGEIKTLSPAGRMFTMGLILSAMTITFYTASMITKYFSKNNLNTSTCLDMVEWCSCIEVRCDVSAS